MQCDPGPCDVSTGGMGGAGQGGSTGDAGSGPKGNIVASVAHYDYAFDLDTNQASSTLSLDVTQAGDCYAISSELDVLSNVTWNDQAATMASVQNDVLSACGGGVPVGSTLTLGSEQVVPTFKYLGLDVGFSRKKNMAGGDFAYLLSWVGGCDRFGPCDDDPSRMASFHFDVKHPSTMTVLCPGSVSASPTNTQCDVSDAPTYSAFAIVADSLWERKPFGTFAGVDLVFYEVPVGGLAKALDKTSVSTFMDWITTLLGPFPYGNELRIAGGPTAWLGFEHPANIVLQEKLNDLALGYQDGTMHVLMHEIIHQWAGDRSTLAAATDFVWKEATAEYLAYVFEDEKLPPNHAAATRAYWDGIALQSKHFPRPTDEPAPAVQSFYGDVYGPGPMVLYLQLEPLIGRAAVLAGIQAFLATSGGRSVLDLQKAMSDAAGKDLKPYFDAWVFGAGAPEWPTFAVAATEASGEATVTVAQQNASGKLYGCVVEVEIKGATQTARVSVDFGLDPQSAKNTATVAFSEPITSVTLDPDHRLIGWKSGAPPLSVTKPVWIF